MPGGHSSVKPAPANYPPSASDEILDLESYLQQQLQEDIARIFDESIYSDVEVVCGKLKILTHSCILKSRTNNFYRKLETILHLNIDRSTFEEIYSFISDVYTECDINHQENEIITYLEKNLNQIKPNCNTTWKTKHEIDEQDIFLTPKCSPYTDKALTSSSPSTELTKEYYSLVPIDSNVGNLLDKELKEQDLLFDAFHSIIKSQEPEPYKIKNSRSTKPTTLYLNFDKKFIKNSASCDNFSELSQEDNKIRFGVTSQKYKEEKEFVDSNYCDYKTTTIENVSDKGPDSTYSPDSLIADDPSSSSDYLSAAYASFPGVTSSSGVVQLNASDIVTKMENVFTSSDSGLENTGLLESITSHKDVTLADLSLNESTLHDLTADDASNSHDSMSMSSPLEKHKHSSVAPMHTTIDSAESNSNCQSANATHRHNDSKSSKEEKQRQNEEIVIMESSSLSSETGSWESVFPPKVTEKDICALFITHERELINQDPQIEINYAKDVIESSSKSPFKSCFIDASLLIDDDENTIKMYGNSAVQTATVPSQPVPISSNKLDLSPNDWSESNDIEDSLEQTDNKETNHKDLSPTIFEMTPVTEDSLISDAFESVVDIIDKPAEIQNGPPSDAIKQIFQLPTTPHNSLRVLSTPKSQGAQDQSCNESDVPVTENIKNVKQSHEYSPIISGGASIKDHLPQISNYSPITRKKLENVPIVSEAFSPNLERCQSQSPKPTNSATWVIDVSNNKCPDFKKHKNEISKNLDDSANNINVENCNRSRSSVDSDGSEKSSHKFYIDLSNMPSSSSLVKQTTENAAEKKYIFSMFIDLEDKTGVKKMPARLSSSINAKKSNVHEASKSGICTKGNNEVTEIGTTISIDPPIINNDTHDFEKYECLCEDPNMTITDIISLPKKILVNMPKKVAQGTEKSDVSGILKSEDKKEHIIERDGAVGPIPSGTNVAGASYVDEATDIDISSDQEHYEEQSIWNEAGTSGFCYDVPGRYSTASTIREESTTDVESTNDIESGDNEFFYTEKPAVPEPFVKLSDLDKPLSKTYSTKTKKEKAIDMRMTRSIPENAWCGNNHSGAPVSLEVISSFHSENALSLNRLFPHLQNEISRSMPGSLSSRTRSPMRPGTISSAGEPEDQASDVSELSSIHSSACRSIVGISTPEDTGQTSSIINQCQSRLGQDLLRMFLEEIAPDVIVEVSGRRIKAHKCILSSRCQYFAGILSGGWVESAGNVIPLPPFAYNVVHFALCHIYSGTSAIPEAVSIVELATLADMLGLEGLKEAIMFSLKSKYCHHFHRPCPVCTAGVLECFPLSSLCGLDDLYHKCLRWITKYFPKVWPTRAFSTLPADLQERCFQQHIVNMTVENVADTVFGCGLAMMTLQSNIRGVDNVDVMCRRLINASAQFAAPRLVTVLRSMEPLPLDAPTSTLRALDEFVEAAIHRAPIEEVCRAYAYLESVVVEIEIQQLSKPDLISNGYQNNVLTGDETLVHARANLWKLKCQYLLVEDALRVVNTQAFRELPTILQQKLRKSGCVASSMQAHIAPTMHNSRPARALNVNHADIEHMRVAFVPYAPQPSTSYRHAERELRSKAQRVPRVKTTKAQEERAKFNMAKNAQAHTQSNKSTRMFENAKPRYLEPKAMKQPEKKMATQGKLMPKIMLSSSESSRTSPIQTRAMRGARVHSRPMQGRGGQAMSQDSLATSSRPRTAEPSTDSLSESQTSNKYATFTIAKHARSSVESSTNVSSRSQQSTHSKNRTKIPVSTTGSKPKPTQPSKSSSDSKKSNAGGGRPATTATAQPARVRAERKVPGSLMNATKSSSAKVVQRAATKEKMPNNTKTTKPASSRLNSDSQTNTDIPVMGRSGTFLKDEPTFGHNTLDIDK